MKIKGLFLWIYDKIREWRSGKVAEIDHEEIIRNAHADAEFSAGYLLVLIIADLIALCGLLTNSSPVIIGAMLISPLMGPFLSFGFAFITGEREIWNRSVGKISLSVLLTILFAALATYMSPLKEPTAEILARVKPNLYDLVIAFLAGMAGAVAICTKKNYLTIVPGVAIATAVIPPLSVAGFGAGTANFRIFSGGFLLFFTNFVAIIISTCAVFYFYDFRPSIYSHYEHDRLKMRIVFLAAILVLISIPLAYTLRNGIAEVRMRTSVGEALRHELDREKRFHLTKFTYSVESDGSLKINAMINTVAYLDDPALRKAETGVANSLKRKVTLDLEQIKVQSGGLREPPLPLPTQPAAPRPPWETIRDLRRTVIESVGQAAKKMDRIIAPAVITEFSAGFNDKSEVLSVSLKMRRDTPFSDMEILWLQRTMADYLNLPVELHVETVPFVPLLVFKPGVSSITPEMRNSLLLLKDVVTLDPRLVVKMEAYDGSDKRRGKAQMTRLLKEISAVLERECNIPPEKIASSISNKRLPDAAVRISAIPSGTTRH